MNIILLSSFCKKKGSIDICVPGAMAWVVPGVALFSALLLLVGYELGSWRTAEARDTAATAELRQTIERERRALAEAKSEQQANLDALALRVARLQAHLMRLDALGERLANQGKLDPKEFDFSTEPAQGGVEGEVVGSAAADEIVDTMNKIDRLLADREAKLRMLEAQLGNRKLIRETSLSGRPVAHGWISSTFGRRTDPITGKKAYHHGIDFAGKEGEPVHAVAAGVVVRSDKGKGFGNRVEIRHPDGYSTVYAHNAKNMVSEGDIVAKGQVIALLGNTGRSTGPHVHFEVHRQGKLVDPKRYIRAP